ncbi:hypothetical protein HYPSUDRAFT_36646 [Hypholoma sublateritium FD-334 SS-4]|uniref:Auxin efflux carrier n=1 Tax=Hypholoma sublateritium (strain FD-334 SS-4) TaxID=945553 RepID=A0A0D2Q3Z9_HYPSF|nr:hypothetical protein HYPSUDRAFT_36646 [Hypholoma sublateritium FD-334 SS-4]
MVAAGTLIWISCRPLIRLIFCIACGFGITKADIFPPVAASGAGQIVLSITLPCLMFSKIVPAFTTQNAGALGPLIVIALLYEALGMAMAFVIKQFLWVPHRFRYGILVAGGWGNVGDIPTAVIMSITGAAPFQGIQDQNLAVAYISAFILVFLVTLFPFGGHKLVAWDFEGGDIEPEEVQEAMRLKRSAYIHSFKGLVRGRAASSAHAPGTVLSDVEKPAVGPGEHVAEGHQRHTVGEDAALTQLHIEGIKSLVTSPSPTEFGYQTPLELPETLSYVPKEPGCCSNSAARNGRPPTPQNARRRIRIQRRSVMDFLKSFLTPTSMAILVSFPIALVPKLKALFVEVPGTVIHPAPDGLPPLAFILDSTTFVGAASVPLGLICLGSSLARLPFPQRHEWKALPMGAVMWIAIMKMLIMPVLGVLICQGLTNVGFISKEDKVLRLVCM